MTLLVLNRNYWTSFFIYKYCQDKTLKKKKWMMIFLEITFSCLNWKIKLLIDLDHMRKPKTIESFFKKNVLIHPVLTLLISTVITVLFLFFFNLWIFFKIRLENKIDKQLKTSKRRKKLTKWSRIYIIHIWRVYMYWNLIYYYL